MEFLKNNRRFDFVYGGKPFAELSYETHQTEDGDTLTTVYTLPDGLKITNIATKHGDAYEWVNWWENTADTPSEIISELWDAAIELPMPYEEPIPNVTVVPLEDYTTVYAPYGSNYAFDDFCSYPDEIYRFRNAGHLDPGSSKTYATSGGRSSEKHAPFFNVHKDNMGYIFAIGWTGQWNSYFERTEETLIVKAKIEDTHFRLLPGEKIRTASFVFMPYDGTAQDGQNKWRRLVKKDFSHIGQEGREPEGPLCVSVWGGMNSAEVLECIRVIRENNLPATYLWMDAAWYGKIVKTSKATFVEWWKTAGDWAPSAEVHPNGLMPVGEAAHEAGLKFMLWVEPERAHESSRIVAEHPEYFCPHVEGKDSLMLNLGKEDAWQWCYTMLTDLFDKNGVDAYRQDFNWEPLDDWRKNDTPDRQGITEIKHIMGLYRLWEALLDRYPHMLIDNCASGGRRIDIETLRRSVPLWRTDYPCGENYRMEGIQSQCIGFGNWMPYSGTNFKADGDVYQFRSSYSPAMVIGAPLKETAEEMAWTKDMLAEYLKVRPYLSEDFYPLTEVTERKDTWYAVQYHNPEQNDGVLQAFRREKSPYPMAEFALFGLDTEADYVFTDADTGAETLVNGQTLMTQGFCVTIPEKRASKLYFYKKK